MRTTSTKCGLGAVRSCYGYLPVPTPFPLDERGSVLFLEALLNMFIFLGKRLFKFPHECSEYISWTWACFKAHSLTPNIKDDSNINAIPPSIIFCGFNSIFDAYNEPLLKEWVLNHEHQRPDHDRPWRCEGTSLQGGIHGRPGFRR